jgi:hypothetical protein
MHFVSSTAADAETFLRLQLIPQSTAVMERHTASMLLADRKDRSIVQVGRDDCWAQLGCARHAVLLAGCMESVYVLLVSLASPSGIYYQYSLK